MSVAIQLRNFRIPRHSIILLLCYESETWSLTLMDERKLGVFEGRVVRLGLIGSHRRLERVWV